MLFFLGFIGFLITVLFVLGISAILVAAWIKVVSKILEFIVDYLD